ncbi:MAG TPA: CoA transferase subunit A [Kofleriaceae bacterium]|nr:CoA transferase subunit A [Kofleriaceae bacterium]
MLGQGRHHHKVKDSVAAALDGLESGMTVMVGGFGLCGNAEALIAGVIARGAKDLTLVSNNAGNLGKGLATWLRAGIVRKVICSYLGNNEDLHSRMAAGTVQVEVTPQGTLVERMRAAGAGIPAFFTPTGVGTVVEDGKETREIDGRRYLLERALPADFALIRARKVDRFGNLRFYRTARNFSPVMATAARTTVVEADELVDVGAIDPDDVHLSGIYVHRIVEVREHEDPIEYKTTRPRPTGGA